MSSRVNEVNGENLQDPPIKNPGYANGGRGIPLPTGRGGSAPPQKIFRCFIIKWRVFVDSDVINICWSLLSNWKRSSCEMQKRQHCCWFMAILIFITSIHDSIKKQNMGLFRKHSKSWLSSLVLENKIVAHFLQINMLFTVGVQYCNMIESFLSYSRSNKSFQESQRGKFRSGVQLVTGNVRYNRSKLTTSGSNCAQLMFSVNNCTTSATPVGGSAEQHRSPSIAKWRCKRGVSMSVP